MSTSTYQADTLEEARIRKAFTNGCRAKIKRAWDAERAHQDENTRAYFAGQAAGWEDANAALRNADEPTTALRTISSLAHGAQEVLMDATEADGPTVDLDYAEERWDALEDAYNKLALHIRAAADDE